MKRYPIEPVERIAAITGCAIEVAEEIYRRRDDPNFSVPVKGTSRTLANYALFRAGVVGSFGPPGMRPDLRPLRAFVRRIIMD